MSAKARGRRGRATEGRGRRAKTVRAPRSTRHFTTTRAGSAGASSSRFTSVARRRCTVRSSSSGRKYAGSPGATSMPKNGDMAPRAEGVPSYRSSRKKRRQGEKTAPVLVERNVLVDKISPSPSRSPLWFYLLLDASPHPYGARVAHLPASAAVTASCVRLHLNHRAKLYPCDSEKKEIGSVERVAGKASATARTRARVSYRDEARPKHAPAQNRSRCDTRAGCSSSAALSRRTA